MGVLSALGTLVGGSVHVLASGIGTLRDLDDLGHRVPSRPPRRSGLPCLRGDFDDSETACKWEYANCRTAFSRKLFAGIATEVLNPKTALFFLSFIPQFVSPAKGHLILQFLILGAISVVLNTTVDLVVVGFAGLIAQRLARNPKLIERQRTGSGVGMIGLGVYVAVSK